MRFRILGPVDAHDDTGRIAINGAKLHTMLAALLLADGRVVADNQLSTLLWGWDPPATAGAQLYTYVSRLRKSLAPDVDIERRQPGYLFRIGTARLDYHDFVRLALRGRGELQARRYERAAATYREALALWRGTALATVTEFMASAEQPRLQEARVAALEARIEADLALGRHDQLIPELVRLVGENPAHEPLRVQLMTALYRCDRQADAISVFHGGRRILADELGIDPGPRLRATFQSIIEGSLPRGPAATAAPPADGAERPMMDRPMLVDEILSSLVAAKLIQPTRNGCDGRPRYRLHERVARMAGHG